jgi:hypothetical protein
MSTHTQNPLAAVAAAVVVLAAGRVVRADVPAGQFTKVADGVRDTKTGLVWETAIAPDTMPYDEASKRCASLPGGFRVPTVKELLTLVDDTPQHLDAALFPGSQPKPYWTSTPVNDGEHRWVVDWGELGRPKAYWSDYEPQYVRCVR